MTLAIMQPYLLPYIGYWQLINTVDTFVVYDNIEFSKNGWFHRNNILLNGKKKLFTIPLKNDSDSLSVADRYLAENSDKQIRKFLAQIKNSYKKAPYFKEVFPIIESILLNKEKNLFKYIFYSIKKVCEYCNINTKIIISSDIKIDHTLKSQAKVVAINKILNSNRYINPIGGVKLYDKDYFKEENINLLFLESEVPPYNQFQEDYISHLSIIDIMMFNNKENIASMLNKFILKDIES
ncbi:MAG: hypothetical protein DRG78_13435 [Epsilonproteobacteria bacterium]|nr:MAG: hypothetical protein DRG78_13435 [Campylobacterota bacterium]